MEQVIEEISIEQNIEEASCEQESIEKGPKKKKIRKLITISKCETKKKSNAA